MLRDSIQHLEHRETRRIETVSPPISSGQAFHTMEIHIQ